MKEKEFIKKIQELRQIKPDKNWVNLKKKEILGEDMMVNQGFFSFFLKPYFLAFSLISLFFALVAFSENSLPGDFLYPLKKTTEGIKTLFLAKEELPKLQLELANKRLEELKFIAQTNQMKKLAPAINEFQSNISQATKHLAKVKKVDKEIIKKTAEIEEKREVVEKVLGTTIGTSEYKDILKQIVEGELKELEKRSLTEKEKEMLEEIKKEFEKENYSQALEKILNLSNNSN